MSAEYSNSIPRLTLSAVGQAFSTTSINSAVRVIVGTFLHDYPVSCATPYARPKISKHDLGDVSVEQELAARFERSPDCLDEIPITFIVKVSKTAPVAHRRVELVPPGEVPHVFPAAGQLCGVFFRCSVRSLDERGLEFDPGHVPSSQGELKPETAVAARNIQDLRSRFELQGLSDEVGFAEARCFRFGLFEKIRPDTGEEVVPPLALGRVGRHRG